MFRSKTLWFSVLLAVCGVIEQSSALVTQTVGPQNTGYVMLGVSVIVAVLRFLTTQPLSEKGAGGGV